MFSLLCGAARPLALRREAYAAASHLQPMKDGLPAQGIFEEEEEVHRVAGVLPASTIMTRRLQAQEYVEDNVVEEGPVAATCKTIRAPGIPGSRTGSPWGPGRQGRMVRNAPGRYLHARWVFVSDGWGRGGGPCGGNVQDDPGARDSWLAYRFTMGSWTARTDGAKRAGELPARSVGVRIRWMGSWWGAGSTGNGEAKRHRGGVIYSLCREMKPQPIHPGMNKTFNGIFSRNNGQFAHIYIQSSITSCMFFSASSSVFPCV